MGTVSAVGDAIAAAGKLVESGVDRLDSQGTALGEEAAADNAPLPDPIPYGGLKRYVFSFRLPDGNAVSVSLTGTPEEGAMVGGNVRAFMLACAGEEVA